jgi:hypothetical protein
MFKKCGKFMKITTKTSLLLATTLFVASATFAQAQGNQGRGGFFENLRNQIFGERQQERQNFADDRKEDSKDFRNDMNDARENLRKGIQERRDFMASTTASGTTPTPWKDFRNEVKDAKKDFIQERKGDMKNFKEDRKEDMKKFVGAGFLQNATATANLATKLGTTTAALQQMAASGTLQAFINNKLPKVEADKIMRPIFGTSTPIFATNTPVTVTITQGNTVVSTTTNAGFWGFLNRFFGR